jgi:DNA-binding NarL/FixJ family response regulator
LIVDDDQRICRAWGRTLRAHGFEAVAAHTLSEARAAVSAQRFDIVLLDLQLEHEWGLDFLDVTDGLRPKPAVAVTSAHIDDEVAVHCMGRCAATIPKPIKEVALLECVTKLALSTSNDWLAKARDEYRLSRRESEYVRAAADGFSMKETATMMGCKPGTVAGYRRRAFKKTGARSRAQLIAMAFGERGPSARP